MNEYMTSDASEISFKQFILADKRNRTTLWLIAITLVVQLAVFKYLYPYASYIHGDSFSYLRAAYYNLNINTYMVGYSRFLRLFSVFTTSDFALVAFQYLLIQGSALFLQFSLFYFYKPRKVIQLVLLCFMTLNPLFLHLANLVSSDGFFLSLSMIWFASLLWIIHKPSKQIILVHIIVLFIAFTVRYNALMYPFISGFSFLIARFPIRVKIAAFGLAILLCGLFVFYTSYQYKQLTGYWQYSPFSGWQFANNAMYAYRYVNSKERKPVDKKFRALDNMIREYFDSTRDVKKHPQEAMMASTIYMWTPHLSLFKYRDSLFKKDTAAGELKKWASMGPFYKAYGIHIIRKYPWHFVRYFIWPNAQKYYAPPVEFLNRYNSGYSTVIDVAKVWFGYTSLNISARMKNNNVRILDFYPILSGIMNVVMLCILICYLLLQGWKYTGKFRTGVLLGGGVWILNAGFTIFASSAALRFQSFPLLLTICFVCLLLDWLWSVAFTNEDVGKPLIIDDQFNPLPEKAMA